MTKIAVLAMAVFLASLTAYQHASHHQHLVAGALASAGVIIACGILRLAWWRLRRAARAEPASASRGGWSYPNPASRPGRRSGRSGRR
jgi:hypothetical protein